MEIWYIVPVKNIIVPVLCLQIGIVNDVFRKLLYFIDYDVDRLSTGDEVSRNRIVTVNQVIAKMGKTAKYGMSMMVLFCDAKLCR